MGILDGTYDGARDARAAAYVRKQEEKSFRGLLKLFNRACDATGRPRYEELCSPRPFQSAAMPPSSMVKSSDFEEATPVSHHLARSDASPMIITPPPGLGWDTEERVSVTPELARTTRRRQPTVANREILATPTVRCSTEAKEFKKREAEERRTPGGVAYSYERPPGDMEAAIPDLEAARDAALAEVAELQDLRGQADGLTRREEELTAAKAKVDADRGALERQRLELTGQSDALDGALAELEIREAALTERAAALDAKEVSGSDIAFRIFSRSFSALVPKNG